MRISDWSSDVCSSDLAPARQDARVFQRKCLSKVCGEGPGPADRPLYRLFHPGAGWPAGRLSNLRQLVPYRRIQRSEEHTSELQSLMRISYAVFCLKKKKKTIHTKQTDITHRKFNLQYIHLYLDTGRH